MFRRDSSASSSLESEAIEQTMERLPHGVRRLAAQLRTPLEITEFRSEGLLSFKMVKGDFRRFEGAWRVNELADGCSLVYELTVQGCIGMPIALIEERLRDDLSSNLQAVMMEAKRRRG